MEVNLRIRWAALFGICFLLAIIFQQSILGALSAAKTSSDIDNYLRFLILSLVFLVFFGTYILYVRGYAALGKKYDLGLLHWTSYGFIYVIGISCVAILASNASQAGFHAFGTVANTVAGLMFPLYVTGPAVIGLSVLPLRTKLGFTAILPAILGSIVSFYGIYIICSFFLGVSTSEFLGVFVWSPVPEALVVISGIPVFFQAASD